MILDVEFWGSRLSFTSTGEVAQGMSSELNMIRFGILLKVNLYNKLMGWILLYSGCQSNRLSGSNNRVLFSQISEGWKSDIKVG